MAADIVKLYWFYYSNKSMKRSSVSPIPKSKNKSLTKTASSTLVDFVNQQYPKKVSVAAITAATKYYARGKPLNKDDKILKRLAGKDKDIPTASLVELITNQSFHEKGKSLTEGSVKRVYQNYANAEGKLTFEYIMKMGESSGVCITEKMAKKIVKKYGKKDYLNS